MYNSTVRDARQLFLSRAPEVINATIDNALGKGEDNLEKPELLLEIMKRMLPMMKLEDDRRKVEIKFEVNEQGKVDNSDIINQLYKMQFEGKLSDNELHQAMDILRTRVEIEDVNELMTKLYDLENNK